MTWLDYFRKPAPEPVFEVIEPAHEPTVAPKKDRITPAVRRLRARVTELEAVVYDLRKENHALTVAAQRHPNHQVLLNAEIQNANDAGKIAQKWEIRARNAERELDEVRQLVASSHFGGLRTLAESPQNWPVLNDHPDACIPQKNRLDLQQVAAPSLTRSAG